MNSKNISMAVIRRLPKYYRYLEDLLEKDINRISSKEMSEMIGFTASQIRQDLNNFGGFGQQGYGYNVEDLHREIGNILGLSKTYKSVVIGAGNLGQAIANYQRFKKSGFEVKALFDIDEKLIGKTIRNLEVKNADLLEEYIDQNEIDIVILCIHRNGAQQLVDRIVKSGIKAIWNFAPLDLEVPSDVIVENVNLTESLFTLSYLMNESK